MSNEPSSDTDLWEDYPVDDRPLPAPGSVPPPARQVPVAAVARAFALLVVVVSVIAVLLPQGGDVDSEKPASSRLEASEPALLPFVDELDSTTLDSTALDSTTVLPARDVRWPDDFGWAVTGDAYFSGCVPGSKTSLPDGVWFGYVTAIDSSSIQFDLACHYGIEQIDELDSPFIENSDKSWRELPLAPSAAVFTFSNEDGPVGPLGTGDYMVSGWGDGLPEAVVTVVGGEVVEIRHQPAAG